MIEPRRSIAFLSILACTAFLLLSCSSDDDPTDPGGGGDDAIENFIEGLPHLNQVAEEEYAATDTTVVSVEGGEYNCQVITHEGAPGMNELIFKRSNLDVLYPGALLNGESVQDGSYTLCSLPRAPVTLTVNLQGLGTDISRTIDEPAYSTIQTAIAEILDQEITVDPGAEMTWEVTEVYSAAHLKASLGLNVDIVDVFGISGEFDFDSSISHRHVVAKFYQKYYDIIIDQPTSATQFLDLTGADLEDVTDAFGDCSPAYISTVTYGRMAIFYFKSDSLSFDLAAEVEGFVDISAAGIPGDIGGSTGLEFDTALHHTDCRAYILGGSSASGVAVTDLESFRDYIESGGTYSPDSPGKAMSFTLRYLSDRSPVRIIMATEYEETICEPTSTDYRFTLDGLEHLWMNGGPLCIDIRGPVVVTGQGLGDPTGGGFLWPTGGSPGALLCTGSYYGIDEVAIIRFEPLSEAQRYEAWIDIDVSGMHYNHWIENYYNEPHRRIYLSEIVSGSYRTSWDSNYSRLFLDYTIEVIRE